LEFGPPGMDAYEEFLQSIRRDINCLSDRDRNTRKGAVQRLEKTFVTAARTPRDILNRAFVQEVHKPVFVLFGDATEKARELSLEFVGKVLPLLGEVDLNNVLPVLLAALVQRLNKLPWPEQSEVIRVCVLELLLEVIKLVPECCKKFGHDLLDAIAKASTDPNPDAKQVCCNIVQLVAENGDRTKLSRSARPLLAALMANLKHQRWKVRKANLEGLKYLMAAGPTMWELFDELLPALSPLTGDRNNAVRRCLVDCVETWLTRMCTEQHPQLPTDFEADEESDQEEGFFGAYEHRLLYLLLSTLSDEDVAGVAEPALQALTKIAQTRVVMKFREFDEATVKYQRAVEMAAGKEAPIIPPEPRKPQKLAAFDYGLLFEGVTPDVFRSAGFPHEDLCTYVSWHLHSVLLQVLNNVLEWTVDVRSGAVRLLRVLLVVANRSTTRFVDQCLVHLYRACTDEEAPVAAVARQCAALLGFFVSPEVAYPIIAVNLGVTLDESLKQDLEDNEAGFVRTGLTHTRVVGKKLNTNGIENKKNVFIVLSCMLASCKGVLKEVDVLRVLRFVDDNTHNEDILNELAATVVSVLRSAVDLCVAHWARVTNVLLRLKAAENCDDKQVDESVSTLARAMGLESVAALYVRFLNEKLADLVSGGATQLWGDASPRREMLETLVRHAGAAVAVHYPTLVPVLKRQANPDDASVIARIGILELCHDMICTEEEALLDAIKTHSAPILDGVLIPNAVWRPGQASNKIRKASMICVYKMLQRQVVTVDAVESCFSDLVLVIKNCLDDNWSPDNRLLAVLVVAGLLKLLQPVIGAEDLRDLYPDMLKRLDDSNDEIRVTICTAFEVFFRCLPPNWSKSLYEYILKTLFIHLDDPSERMQAAVGAVLEVALHHDTATFLVEARTAQQKSMHPRKVEELIALASNLGAVDVIME